MKRNKTMTRRFSICCSNVLLLALIIALSLIACRTIKEVSEKDQAASESYYMLAVTCYRDGKVIDAIGSLKEAEKLNPRDVQVKNMFGIIYIGKKMWAAAEKSFKEAIEIDPEFSDAYLNLSTVFMENGEFEKAIEMLKKPANDLMYPRKDLAYDNMGWCYHKLGDNIKAIEYLIMATTENPKQCHAWYNMGLIYKSDSKYSQAVKAFAKCTTVSEKCDKFFLGHYELGIAAFRAKDYEKSKAALTRCVELGKERPEVSECRNYLSTLSQM